MSNGTTSAESSLGKCDLLLSHFSSITSNNAQGNLDSIPSPSSVPGLSTITCDSSDVYKAISSLPQRTASGPDGISSQMLKGTADVISSSLASLFSLSLKKGVVPTAWKLANITPVYKAGDPKLVSNYRPIALLSLPSKLLERIVHSRLLSHVLSNSFLSLRQFGFRPASSTQEAILSATKDWHQYLDRKSNVAAIFFDLSKAFDTVPHRGLISALSRIGVSGSLLRWFTSYLSDRRQQVVVDGSTSASSLVRSGVPQGSILGPLLFSIYIDPITSLSLSSTSKILLYADDILLYKPILCEEDEIALQSDINIIYKLDK